ncbi:hypothetical protein MCEMSEM23_00644 [Rhabdaerophilaceae bacterium]
MPMLAKAISTKAMPIRIYRINPDRRAPPRVKISIGGRFMLEDMSEHGGTVVDASIRVLNIKTDAVARLGERVVTYFDTLGRVEGTVEVHTQSGFMMEMATTVRKRDKLASQLTWLANRAVLNLPEDRRHDRIVPRDPRILLKNLSDMKAGVMSGHLIDVSQGGCSVSIQGYFQKGDELMLGTTPARVVRAFEGGIAIEFKAPIPDFMFSSELRL